MYYILNESARLLGWDKVPFAVGDPRGERPLFFNREQYEVVLDCDGVTNIERDKLSEAQRATIDMLLGNEAIRECEKGTQLKDHQRYHFYPNMFKSNVQWSITGKCNYKCKHCFMSGGDGVCGEATLEECIQVLDELHAAGVYTIGLTGGEPMVHPNFWEIIDEISKRNMRINVLYSNGALVNEELLSGLHARGQHPSFQLSFDGVGWHDWLRGIDGAEKDVIRAFKLLQKCGCRVTSSMALHRHNLDALNESIRLLASLDVKFLKINIASPEGAWANETEHFLDQNECYEYFINHAIPQYFADGAPMGVQFDFLYNYEPERPYPAHIPAIRYKDEPDTSKFCSCGSMREGFYVGPGLEVLPCMSLVGSPSQDQFPNMHDQPLREILTDSFYTSMCKLTMGDIINHNAECRSCKYAAMCGGGCRANATTRGCTDFLSVDQVACPLFKNGWFERINALMREMDEKNGTNYAYKEPEELQLAAKSA